MTTSGANHVRRCVESFAWLLVGVAFVGAAACKAALRGGLERASLDAGLSPPDALAIAGLPNFGRVDEGLSRSGQPTREGFLEARRQGVRTVVNVRSAHSDSALIEGTGLREVRIPMHQWKVTDDDVSAFLRVATDPASRPVLLHCAQGQDRTGVLVAAYRVVIEGWSKADALTELDRYGSSPLWGNLRSYVRQLDVDAMRSRIGAPSPRPVDVLERPAPR